jgi:hypothetical protein
MNNTIAFLKVFFPYSLEITRKIANTWNAFYETSFPRPLLPINNELSETLSRDSKDEKMKEVTDRDFLPIDARQTIKPAPRYCVTL